MNHSRSLLLALTVWISAGWAQSQIVPELEALQKTYESLAPTADGPYLAAVAAIDKTYLDRLAKAQMTAQQAGKLEEALAIEGDKKAVSAGGGVPLEDEAKTPLVLKNMHRAYRAEIAKLEPMRAALQAKNLKERQTLRNDYLHELDALVLRLTKNGKLQEAMTVKSCRESIAAESDGSALKPKSKLTLCWSCADDADVYLNGKPLKPYRPDFRTRGDEANQVFTEEASVSQGDVITVGARRGGSFGFVLVVADKHSKVVRKTDQRHWKSYEPKDKEQWYLPKQASQSPKRSVMVNPAPWPPQIGIQKKFKGGESIWTREQDQTAFFVSTID